MHIGAVRYINGLTINKKLGVVPLLNCNNSAKSQLKCAFFILLLTFCPHKKERYCYRQTRFRASKYIKNAFAAGALPRTPLGGGGVTALPRPLAEFGEGEVEGRGKGRGR